MIVAIVAEQLGTPARDRRDNNWVATKVLDGTPKAWSERIHLTVFTSEYCYRLRGRRLI